MPTAIAVYISVARVIGWFQQNFSAYSIDYKYARRILQVETYANIFAQYSVIRFAVGILFFAIISVVIYLVGMSDSQDFIVKIFLKGCMVFANKALVLKF